MAETRHIVIDGSDLSYELTRKRVKNVNMRIETDGTIAVSANGRVPLEFIDDFVISKRELIEKARLKYSSSSHRTPNDDLELHAGSVISLLGKHLTVKVLDGKPENVLESVSELSVTVRDSTDTKRIDRLIRGYIRQLTVDTFRRFCHEIYPHFAAMGVSYPQVKIKTMRSRWGSCIPSKGIIALNSRLIEYPPECIEYVVLHEFCHFIHADHSKAFYDLVASFMPDWKERRHRLAE